jgi:hypothetical protein
MKRVSQNEGTDWSRTAHHPADDDLLLQLDGELSEAANNAVKTHLEACWACRVRTEQLQAAISNFMAYRDRFDVAQHVPPPRNWQTFDWQLQGLLNETAAKVGQAGILSRAKRFFFGTPLMLRWTTAGAVLALTVLAGLKLNSVPAVSANELLHNAARAEAAALNREVVPVVHRKLLVRRKSVAREDAREESLRWEIWSETAGGRFWQAVEDGGQQRFVAERQAAPPQLLHELQQLLRANHFDWQRPLSATVYQAWRQSLPDKREEVSTATLANRAAVLILKTIPVTPVLGGITEASLLVRASDWHPLEQRWRVRHAKGEQEYSIAEEAFEVLNARALDPAVFSVQIAEPLTTSVFADTAADATSNRPASMPDLGKPDLAGIEAEVRETLHRFKADLGEPIEIVRLPTGQLEVRGLVNTAQRKQELVTALHDIPQLSLNLRTVEEVAREAKPLTDEQSENQEVGGVLLPIQELLDQRRPGQYEAEELRELANRALTHAEAVMAEAWALRRLAERYPAEELAQLAPAARAKIEAIVRDHLRALRGKAERARATLKPILTSVTSDATVTGEEWPREWPAFSGQLFKTAQQLDRAANALFASGQTERGELAVRLKRNEANARALLQALAVLETRLE